MELFLTVDCVSPGSYLVALKFILMPFAQESWLAETCGDDYDEYWDLTARFVGIESFRQLF